MKEFALSLNEEMISPAQLVTHLCTFLSSISSLIRHWSRPFWHPTDNAYDPDVQAKELRIDKKNIQQHEALVFTDNGAGMDSDKLYKMLS